MRRHLTAILVILLTASSPAMAQSAPPAAPLTLADAVDAAGGEPCRLTWPRTSLLAAEAGQVDLMLLVEADGKVSNAKLIKSSGYRDLDRATVTGMAKCRLPSSTAQGTPAMAWQAFTHEWKPGYGFVGAMARFDGCNKPDWPKEALRDENQGAVILSFRVGADGVVQESRLDKSSGFPLLDVAAQEGIGRCQFSAATMDGKPVSSWMTMKYIWTIESPSDAEVQQALSKAREGAARGEALGQFQLGMIYFNGQGVTQDLPLAIKWIRQAADQDLPMAQEALGMIVLANGQSNRDEALAWYAKAATHGRASAQYVTAMLLFGKGQTAQAVRWLRLSSDQGLARSRARLGIEILRDSTLGTVEDAIAMLDLAARQNDRSAQGALARCYETGRGVKQDVRQAADLYTKAAAGGNIQAQLALARLYETGQGVPQDAERARELYQRARQQPAAATMPAIPADK